MQEAMRYQQDRTVLLFSQRGVAFSPREGEAATSLSRMTAKFLMRTSQPAISRSRRKDPRTWASL